MHVVATAGHVDHGKSTLVRALTGIEPDRWAEERRRGLTIDLGFAWTRLPSGRTVGFVDVPGHERFLGNMLTGLGPAAVVCFVVAADEGWQAQSSDHRDAVAALGIDRGLIVVTKADRAPERVAPVLAQVRSELAGTGLRDAPAVTVSARDGTGLDGFRAALDRVLAGTPAPPGTGRVRLWLDRAFSVSGAGTVVTGTLTAGTLRVGDRLSVLGRDAERPVTVRSLQSHNAGVSSVGPTNRVAVNLRGIPAEDVRRGDLLLTPGAWPLTDGIDVRRTTGPGFRDAAAEVVLHAGTAAVPARLRPFDEDHARLLLEHSLPLVPGDRAVLRYPGGSAVLGGARVLETDPGPLRRRGDSAAHTRRLAVLPDRGDARAEIVRRGAVRDARLRMLGLLPEGSDAARPQDSTGGSAARPARPSEAPPEEGAAAHPAGEPTGPPLGADVRRVGEWWLHRPVLAAWASELRAVATELHERDPLAPGLSRGAALDVLGLPAPGLLDTVVREAGLRLRDGYLALPGSGGGLGAAEPALARVEQRLRARPFAAPEAHELAGLGLGARELAAAERLGRVLRLEDGVVLLPSTPALAMRELAGLEQPFTTSQARQAWDTTRRVAIPLLEHLDARGWTRRVDGNHRTIVR